MLLLLPLRIGWLLLAALFATVSVGLLRFLIAISPTVHLLSRTIQLPALLWLLLYLVIWAENTFSHTSLIQKGVSD